MTTAADYVAKMMDGFENGNGGQENEGRSERGQAESAIDAALTYLEREGDEPTRRNVFAKDWGLKKTEEKVGASKAAQDELYEALVEDAETLADKMLEEHDKERHPHGYHEGDTCKFRDEMKVETEGDKADEVSPKSAPKSDDGEKGGQKKPLVSPEEDKAYMEAVERGDVETAAKMVREVAGRAFPNTMVVDKDGLPKIVFHNTDSSWTVPVVPWEGPIEWDGLPGLFFADKEQPQYGKNKISCFVNLTNPLDMNDGGRNFLHGRSSDQIDEFTKQYEDAIKTGENEFEFRDDGVLKITPKGMAMLKYDGYFGEHPEDETGKVVEYAVMSGRQVKSADPVTYDDNGNVIPLSRRFDNGDDIRGDVQGGGDGDTPSSVEKEESEDLDSYDKNFTEDGKWKNPWNNGGPTGDMSGQF